MKKCLIMILLIYLVYIIIKKRDNIPSKFFFQNKPKINLYILTFNSPDQVRYTLETMKKTPELLQDSNLFLIDNSTDEKSKNENKKIASENNFSYIDMGGNKGINGGRQMAADHFDKSDADFMLFFEDDMTLNPPEMKNEFCRNGFRKFIPDLYSKIQKIMLNENFDFMKLTFTEYYTDNNTQWANKYLSDQEKAFYNVNEYTKFDKIKEMEGLSYITGDIYYSNWPMIVSKEGNKKMFIENKLTKPLEEDLMIYIFKKTKAGYIKPAVLLASPIWHNRLQSYNQEIRKEN